MPLVITTGPSISGRAFVRHTPCPSRYPVSYSYPAGPPTIHTTMGRPLTGRLGTGTRDIGYGPKSLPLLSLFSPGGSRRDSSHQE